MLGRFRLSRRARLSRSPFSISGIDRILGFEFPAPPTKVCSSECVEGEFSEVRLIKVLRTSHSPGPTPVSVVDSDLLPWGIVPTSPEYLSGKAVRLWDSWLIGGGAER